MQPITLPLRDYVKEAGGFAAVGRTVGVCGQTVSRWLADQDQQRELFMVVDAATRRPVRLVEQKIVWDAS